MVGVVVMWQDKGSEIVALNQPAKAIAFQRKFLVEIVCNFLPGKASASSPRDLKIEPFYLPMLPILAVDDDL